MKQNGSDLVIGHGANVLDKEQYHVPLIFHFYGNAENIKMPQTHTTLNSTVDIAPTLVDFLQFKNDPVDGVSLIPAMKGESLPARAVYLNTGLFINLPGSWGEVKKLAESMKNNYAINSNGAFGLTLDAIKNAKKTISVGAYWKNFRLVYYPKTESEKLTLPALFILMNGSDFHLIIFNHQQMQIFLDNPNTEKLQSLDISAPELRSLYQQLMDYREKLIS